MDLLSQGWHWSVSGLGIVAVMFLLIFAGERFGISSSFRVMCSAVGAKKSAKYFDYNWKEQAWMFIFIAGAIIGGYIGSSILANPNPVAISTSTIEDLAKLGVSAPGKGLLPEDLFTIDFLLSLKGLILFILGGFVIGFGTRWAGGCTSGHAITGMASLQLPSLVAVIGFFIGGLTTTFVLLPLILA